MERFRDRAGAGQQLGQLVADLHLVDPLVLALPRGGVPVGFEVAQLIHAPLDVLVVRKLGVPGHEELAFGAIATGGRILNDAVIAARGLSSRTIATVTALEQAELERRERTYRGSTPPLSGAASAGPLLDVSGREVVLVDDGIATGATIRAGVMVLRTRSPRRIVIATPVAPLDACASLEREVDDVICVSKPRRLRAIGYWYEDFSQTSDDEVRTFLKAASTAQSAS